VGQASRPRGAGIPGSDRGAGDDKTPFLHQLETAVENRTAELIVEARGGPVIPAVRGEPEAERKVRERSARTVAA
jgi:hypothetical protein